jgi:hypothetical protein
MARWALIRAGTVATVVEQVTAPTVDLGGQWVDVTGLHVGPGYTYDGTDFAAPAVVRLITPRQLWQRFTAAERESLEDLAMTGTASVKKKLAAFKTYVMTGMTVDLDDDYIIASVAAMETAGVIAAGRAAEILA